MIATALEYLAIMVAGTAIPLGFLWFFMETLPDLVDAARLALRVARVLFLAIAWVIVIARLLLL